MSSKVPIDSLVAFGSSFTVISIPCPTKFVFPSKLLFKVISSSFCKELLSFFVDFSLTFDSSFSELFNSSEILSYFSFHFSTSSLKLFSANVCATVELVVFTVFT